MSKINIGLFGFGVVGEGLYELLQENTKVNAEIKKICIKHAEKERSLPKEIFTTHRSALIDDPEIDVIVELIDDAEAALEITEAAFKAGKPVVSANKKMIAENLPILLEWQEK